MSPFKFPPKTLQKHKIDFAFFCKIFLFIDIIQKKGYNILLEKIIKKGVSALYKLYFTFIPERT